MFTNLNGVWVYKNTHAIAVNYEEDVVNLHTAEDVVEIPIAGEISVDEAANLIVNFINGILQNE